MFSSRCKCFKNVFFFVVLDSIVCHFSESPGSHHCFGAAGQLLIFHLPFKPNASLLIMKDDKHWILSKKYQGKIKLNEEYADQSQSISNEMLKLGKAMKKHSGYYVLEEFDHHGILLKNVKVYLKVQGKFIIIIIIYLFIYFFKSRFCSISGFLGYVINKTLNAQIVKKNKTKKGEKVLVANDLR